MSESKHPKCADCGANHPEPRARCQRYNGWTNYETWNVALWIDNDQGIYEFWRERSAEILAEPGEPTYASQTAEERAICLLAETLQSEHEDRAGELLNASHGTFCDLLGAALSVVNWYEIAEHLIEAAKEAAAS